MAILDRSGYLNTGMRVSGAKSASSHSAAFGELLSALLSFRFGFFVFFLVFLNENHTDTRTTTFPRAGRQSLLKKIRGPQTQRGIAAFITPLSWYMWQVYQFGASGRR